MDIHIVLYFTAASILLTLAPGPDILFVAAQSVSNGRKAGIATALGLCTGVLAHTFAAAAGISALLYNSALLFQLVKYAGAAYLLYLAWQALKEGAGELSLERVPRQSAGALYRRGILMNMLNPKVSLFFLALLPQFVTPDGSHPALQMMVLGVIFMVQAIVVFSLVSLGAGFVGSKLRARTGTIRWINRAKALLYAVIGLRLMFAQK
ncbi:MULTISPECIES: LysE family translocator [Paenibacillus]|uniref:Homoserine lactone transporter n=1 Tax=Paenibacillus naphthalenovorans TaxID=162209 RepID=A0A0U2W9R7_9BACL|nr:MULTISPECIES: LysE family translocator [Paenibacillus]ALS24229.1 homoserine lactone transporter [Paenibacillus naphthalenovorans]GCL73880.1 LysE family translocator [Paenibacillus naphthalenovorans]SDI50687.1 Threonine/homoserine/homoserine lactone efflux protein [Paenibacillus naphthalenovorans]